MLAATISLYLLFTLVSARRCVDKYYATPECLTQCQFKVLFHGHSMQFSDLQDGVSWNDDWTWSMGLCNQPGRQLAVDGSRLASLWFICV